MHAGRTICSVIFVSFLFLSTCLRLGLKLGLVDVFGQINPSASLVGDTESSCSVLLIVTMRSEASDVSGFKNLCCLKRKHIYLCIFKGECPPKVQYLCTFMQIESFVVHKTFQDTAEQNNVAASSKRNKVDGDSGILHSFERTLLKLLKVEIFTVVA